MKASEYIGRIKDDEVRNKLLLLLKSNKTVSTMYDAIDACEANNNVDDIKFLICQRIKAINKKLP